MRLWALCDDQKNDVSTSIRGEECQMLAIVAIVASYRRPHAHYSPRVRSSMRVLLMAVCGRVFCGGLGCPRLSCDWPCALCIRRWASATAFCHTTSVCSEIGALYSSIEVKFGFSKHFSRG